MKLQLKDLTDTFEMTTYGYPGERDSFGSRAGSVDRAVVKAANEVGVTRDELTEWSLSKCGRWFAEDSGVRLRGSDAAERTMRARQSFAYMRKLKADGLWS